MPPVDLYLQLATTALMNDWHDFYVAVSGAASALAGLVFVALSINLERILTFQGVAERGAETVIMLAAALIIALLALVPTQAVVALGVELAIVGLIAWGLPIILNRRAKGGEHPQQRRYVIQRIVLHQTATLPLVAASVLTGAGYAMGPYVLALGVILSMCAGMINAWTLLVEILR